MLVTLGAPGGSESVVTTRASEAGPSRFLVKARTTMRYLVESPVCVCKNREGQNFSSRGRGISVISCKTFLSCKPVCIALMALENFCAIIALILSPL